MAVFGLLLLVLVPLFVVAQDPMIIVSWSIYLVYLIALAVLFCRLPRWTKSKKGIKKLLRWMAGRS